MHRGMKYRYLLSRRCSTTSNNSAAVIRKTFVDYFVNEHSHKFVKSSSVIPRGDPSLAFVNAGMNQFKSVLLGTEEPISPRVVNSQKCIRVGGKHNDLEAVGKDGTHHTFFEMLGNWSFSDYFKEDACKMAWNLLTGPYGLDKKKLAVTYFGGNITSKLQPDIECAEIWRSLGLLKNQIIPNGMADNFWEMGPLGPCGPCTEIYYVDDGNIMELWNLVFVEYERKEDGLLYLLPKKHVDTGMGLERLVRVLQGSKSNYDTDLFQPMFDVIQKETKMEPYSASFDKMASRDTAYRILADHSRAISVSLADGIFPSQNYKLRKLIRRCFSLSESIFEKNGNKLLAPLLKAVTESLGDTYPELKSNLGRSLEVVENEYNSYEQSKAQTQAEWKKLINKFPGLEALPNDHPGLAQAVTEVKELQDISGKLAFRLHDSLGLTKKLVYQLAECFDLKVDSENFEKLLFEQQQGSRVVCGALEKQLVDLQILPTNDSFKYFWEYNGGHYKFSEKLDCTIVAISKNNVLVKETQTGEECELVTDHTHFYHEAGGQAADIGEIITADGTGEIIDVQRKGNYVIHRVKVTQGVIKEGTGKLKLNTAHRLRCMQNHSAAHLLNAALHSVFPSTYQRSSHVTADYFTFDFHATMGALQEKQLDFLQNFVLDLIKSAVPIKRVAMTSEELPENAIKIPGEDYPENLTVIKIGQDELISIEPCCGTHCSNTRDIKNFCITAEKSAGSGVRSLRALVGDAATKAWQASADIEDEVKSLGEVIKTPGFDSFDAHFRIKAIKNKFETVDLPLLRKRAILADLGAVDAKVTAVNKIIARETVEKHAAEALKTSKSPFVVSMILCECPEPLNLSRGNLMCLPDKASMFLSKGGDGLIRGRCVVPHDMVTSTFNAETWMAPILKIFDTDGSAPKGQDPNKVFGMKPRVFGKDGDDRLFKKAVAEAENFATASLLLSLLIRKQ